MRKSNLGVWIAGVAVGASVALVGAPAAWAAQPHEHDHGAAAPAKLSLDHGRKWGTDAPLRDGMGRIRALVEPQLAAAHGGKLSAAQYAALAGEVETQVAGIVSNCKLEPKADAMLHIVIGEIGAGTDAMAGKGGAAGAAQGLVRVAKAVNAYGSNFDHPGFKPIRGLH